MDKSIHSNDYAIFLQLLRSAREQVGLTQEEIAIKLNETQSFVSKCERGERRLDIVEIRLWCLALGISFIGLIDEFHRACAPAEKLRSSK